VITLQNLKTEVVYRQTALTNGATGTSDNIDCLDTDSIRILVIGTTSDNATNNPSVLKLQECDTTVDTSFADVTAFVGDGASGFTIPSSPTATTTAPFAVFNVDTKTRKRYLRVKISPVTTQTFTVVAEHGRRTQAPVGTTAETAAVIVTG
jgi:hypothetical protein